MSGNTPPPQPLALRPPLEHAETDDRYLDDELDEDDPYTQYSRELYQYTLGLWAESRRIAEEKARAKAAAKKEEEERKRKILETADKADKADAAPSTSTSRSTSGGG